MINTVVPPDSRTDLAIWMQSLVMPELQKIIARSPGRSSVAEVSCMCASLVKEILGISRRNLFCISSEVMAEPPKPYK